MKLEEKIQQLRKQKGWSQEELAFRLDVSRQSVSKWEMGTAIPDLDKVLKMSELFSVSTDYLLKDTDEREDLSAEPNERKEVRQVSDEEGKSYLETVRENAWKIALGVACCVFSPVCMMLLLGVASFVGGLTQNVAAGLGVAVLLAVVAVGVTLLINGGMRLSRFNYLEKEEIAVSSTLAEYIRKKRNTESKAFATAIAVGVSLCIVSAVPLIITGALGLSDGAQMFSVAGLLALVACGVFLFVKFGCVRGSYPKLLQEEEYTVENKRKNKRLSAFSGAYWCIITAVYLLISFLTDRWDRTWIVWPVAGVAFAAAEQIVWSYLKNKKK